MGSVAVTRLLEELEAAMSALYEQVSRRFEADENASAVFFRLAMEERRHAGLATHARKLGRQATEVMASDVEAENVKGLLSSVRAVEPSTLTLAEAVRSSLILEHNLAEGHLRMSLAAADPELGKLLGALGGEDRLHIARLEALAAARGIPLPGV